MSAETDLRAALVAESTLTALVGTRVVQNGVAEGTALPYVIFTSQHAFENNLLGQAMLDAVTFTIECWATGALAADAVADAVVLALTNHAPVANAACLTGRASGFDGSLGLDATVLTVEWWQ